MDFCNNNNKFSILDFLQLIFQDKSDNVMMILFHTFSIYLLLRILKSEIFMYKMFLFCISISLFVLFPIQSFKYKNNKFIIISKTIKYSTISNTRKIHIQKVVEFWQTNLTNIMIKELSFCHKLWFYNPYIISTQSRP